MTKLENSKSSSCLEVNTLMDFVQKNLIGKKHQAVKEHIEDCAYCQDRVEDLQVFYREPVPQDSDYDQQRKSIKQALYRTTWKVYLQNKLEIGKKQVGQIVQNFVKPKFAFPILATFLAVFIFTNVQDVNNTPNAANMNEEQVAANWKLTTNENSSEEDNFGLGVDTDFWQRKIFFSSSISTLSDKERGYRSYTILPIFS